MAIITIARELGSLAEDIARELAAITGFRDINKEILESRLATMPHFGLDGEKLQKFDEKKPGFWASLSQERDAYLHFLKTAVMETALEGDCIILGRGAGVILKGVPSLLSLRIIAPLAVRVERVKNSYSCTEKSALEILERSDHDRRGFQKYFFSMDWADPKEYDLTINTGSMNSRQAAVLLSAVIDRYKNVEKDALGKEKIADMLLAQRVLTQIVYVKRIPIHFLEASALKERVVLHGVANSQAAIDNALTIAREVPGVSFVESAIQIVQEFSVMP